MEEQVHKPHRKSKDKKKPQHTGGLSPINQRSRAVLRQTDRSPERNPKAFAFSKPGKLQRSAARSGDVSLPVLPFTLELLSLLLVTFADFVIH